MTVTTAKGLSQFKLSDIKSVKFAEENVSVYASESTSIWPSAEITSIKFNLAPSGIASAKIGGERVTLRVDGNLLYVEGLRADSKPGVEIISITGQHIYVDGAWHGEPIDIELLSRGIYLLRTDGKSYKFVK